MNRRYAFLSLAVSYLSAFAASYAMAQTSALPKPEKPLGKPLPHRVFASSRVAIDRILARPYDSEVPFGSSGEVVWATSPQGWAFRDGVHLLYIQDKDTAGLFDLMVRSGDDTYVVDKAEYMPSHVHLTGVAGAPLTATASFTYSTDKVDNPLTKPFTPEKRWTCWNSKQRTDTYTVDFGKLRPLTGVDLYFFSDVEQGGGCARPAGVDIELWHNNAWRKLVYALPRSGMPWDYPGVTHFNFYGGPHTGERLRFTFHHRGTNLYTGLYGVEPFFAQEKGKGEKGKRSVSFILSCCCGQMDYGRRCSGDAADGS